MINWPRAIDRNREALPRVVAALFAMAGLGEGDKATPPQWRIAGDDLCADIGD
ncbi:hypothetical protein [Oricola nitratireducens]|uniref:hypothetical protein n=1 Tax=Oricola nitratireducens TaxID=2775868 RepID=UPI001866914E|nr:hypothetical protein [Oricola nitratireducens]